MCGRACAVANTVTACRMGACAVASCAAGFADCDMNPANGCEVSTASDVRNCATCGNVCAVAGGTPACAMGVCGVAACAVGRGDCNGMTGDGCETDLVTSVMHCGSCGMACALPNATARCDVGRCAVASCNAGFADCDMNPANGCEGTPPTPAHCGRCGNACMLPGATSACVMGACAITTCETGRADCDAAAATGCEVTTATDVRHCGGCGGQCAPANAAAVCAAGGVRRGELQRGLRQLQRERGRRLRGERGGLRGRPPAATRRFAPAGSARDQTPSEDISVEVGPRGEVYVLSYADKIIVFDADGNVLRNYPARGWSTSWSIAVDRVAGDMWVADPNSSTVVHLTPDGNPSESWSAGLSAVRGVEYARNELFVSDFGNNRVVVYSRTGTMIRDFRPAGLVSPRGLTVGPSGTIYVTSSGNNTLRVYSAAGLEQRSFATCATPADVAVDECRGVIYVLCEAGDQWVAYRADGTRLYSVGTEGATSHSGIAISDDGARLYVSHSHTAGRATLLFRR